MDYDLRNVSFEAFLDFLFDHPVAAQYREENWRKRPGPSEDLWYLGIGLPGRPKVRHDPGRTTDHYIALFERPEILLERYSRGQIAQGFNLIPGAVPVGFSAGLGTVLLDRRAPMEKRLRLAEALYALHDRLFAAEDLNNAARGLWLKLGIAVSSHRRLELDSEDDETDAARVTGAVFAVLCRLLEHPEARLVDVAVTGMKAIEHWKTPDALRACLDSRDDLTAETREHAQFVIDCFDKIYIKRRVYH